jgi:hypothetical protein
MPTARHGLGSAILDQRFYVISGGPTPGGSYSDRNEIFIPVPSINSSPLKNLGFSDTARLDECLDHTAMCPITHLDETALLTQIASSGS